MPSKTLRFDADVQSVLEQANIQSNGREWTLDLVGQLDRSLYAKVKKAIEAMGGKWNRSRQTHIFKENPLEMLGAVVDNGQLVIDNLGFFPTPQLVIEQMAEALSWLSSEETYLEPSAGEGDIALFLHQRLGVPLKNITCVEIHPGRAARLNQLGFTTYQADFYDDFKIATHFDWVLMNPPFEKDQAMKHILKAFDLLKPGGGLVSVVPETILQRDTQLGQRFRQWYSQNEGEFEKLPEGSFKQVGTGVHTGLLWVFKRRHEPAPNGKIAQLSLFEEATR